MSRGSDWEGHMRRILILALIGLGVIVPAHSALASIVTTDLAHGVTAGDLANWLTGGGLSGSNATYTGARVRAAPLPVSINTLTGGNPCGDPTTWSHPALYRNNDLSDGGGSIDTEMDGLTTVLTCTASVNANLTNHAKLAIADTSDYVLD